MNGDEYPHVPAAFINALAEEGTKDEAIAFLQKQWNETCALRAKLRDTPCDAQSVEPEMPRHAPQTIETAPRDGTHILAWRIPIGIRVTNNTNPPTVVHWFDDPDEPGFYTSVNERAPEHPFNPTHWERLPDPPLSLTRDDAQSAEAHLDAPDTLTPPAIDQLFARDDLYTARAVFARLRNFGYALSREDQGGGA